jgi:response regulator of citrate/malate metabolism
MGVHRNTIIRMEANKKRRTYAHIAEALGRVAGLSRTQATRKLALLKKKRPPGRRR